MVVYYVHIEKLDCLKWKDFSDDLSTISISGDRVKSKRNRIVPVPKYIREILVKKGLEDNIFSGTTTPIITTILRRFLAF